MSFDTLPEEVLATAPPWPLSRLYHEQSKLGPWRGREFRQQIAEFNDDREQLHQAAAAGKAYPTMPAVALPRPSRWRRGGRLRDLLRSRRSQRGAFGGQPITIEQLGALLQSAASVTNRATHPDDPLLSQILRAWPSGGGLYPIEVYPMVLSGNAISPGIYHFDPRNERMARIAIVPPFDSLREILFAEGLLEGASAVIVLTAVFARTQVKYGERGYRVVLLDAGHLAQNLLLVAEDLGLGAVPLGGFDDHRLAELLGLDAEQESPIHVLLIGSRAAPTGSAQ